MKFTCNLKSLNEVVSNVSLPISNKSTIAALEGVLLECKDDQLKLTGYDLDLGITKMIPINVIEPGSIVLNAKLFSEILRKMPDQEISIQSDQKLLTTIEGVDTKFNILGMSRDEYPDIPSIDESQSFNLPDYLLKNMINQTLFASSVNDQTPVLTGSLFDIDKGVLHVVSVDGYRVAIRKEQISANENLSFVVPGKTLSEIVKLLSEDKEDITNIHVSIRHILFEINGYCVVSRLLEGEYLDYKSAIPEGCSTRIDVDTKQLVNSIERTSIIINDRNKSPIKLVSDENIITLTCESTVGKVSDRFEAFLSGEQIRIAFNNKYMIDALKHTECDRIHIDINGALSPIKILPVEGDDFLFLVLPVRLKSE